MTFKVTSYLRIAFVLHKAPTSQQTLSLYPYFLQFVLFGEPTSLVTLDHGQLNSLILQAQWNERFGPRVPRYHQNTCNRAEHTACSAVCCRLKISAPCGCDQLLLEAQTRFQVYQLLKATWYLPVEAFNSMQLPTT